MSKVATVSTEKVENPIINTDKATIVTDDGKVATGKGSSPEAAIKSAASKVVTKE